MPNEVTDPQALKAIAELKSRSVRGAAFYGSDRLAISEAAAVDIITTIFSKPPEPSPLVAKLEAAEDALRSLACWLAAGGYNAPTVDADEFEAKIRAGVDMLLKSETGRLVAKLEALAKNWDYASDQAYGLVSQGVWKCAATELRNLIEEAKHGQ